MKTKILKEFLSRNLGDPTSFSDIVDRLREYPLVGRKSHHSHLINDHKKFWDVWNFKFFNENFSGSKYGLDSFEYSYYSGVNKFKPQVYEFLINPVLLGGPAFERAQETKAYAVNCLGPLYYVQGEAEFDKFNKWFFLKFQLPFRRVRDDYSFLALKSQRDAGGHNLTVRLDSPVIPIPKNAIPQEVKEEIAESLQIY